MTVTIIAAVARNGVIGAGGDMPWRLPGDLPRLKAMTAGHVVLMGRRTYDSIGRPLPDRATVVVTRAPDWSPVVAGDVHVVHSVPDALGLAAKLDDEVYVLGGGEIYAQTLGAADRMEITDVHAEPAGDTFFPDLDWSRWRETARVPRDGFDWVTYTRPTPLSTRNPTT